MDWKPFVTSRRVPARLSHQASSSAPLRWDGCGVEVGGALWELSFAGGAGAGPAGDQLLQFAQDRVEGQAGACAFGFSRSRVRKPCATETSVTW